MASNSLLECFVVAFGAAQSIAEKIQTTEWASGISPWEEGQLRASADEVLVSHNWEEIRRLMWDFVGIVRNNKRLNRADRRIKLLREEIRDHYIKHKVSNDNLELRNLALVSELIITSALKRKESRGLHFTQDYPQTDRVAEDTILLPKP